MVVPRSFIFVVFSALLTKNSIGVVPRLDHRTLNGQFTTEDDDSYETRPKSPRGRHRSTEDSHKIVQELDQTSDKVFGALDQGSKTLNDGVKSFFDSFSKGLNFVAKSSDAVDTKVTDLLNKGVEVVGNFDNQVKKPLSVLSSMASNNMNYFEFTSESKEKSDKINSEMSAFLSKNKVVLPEHVNKPNLLNEKYINQYRDRCLAGDCFTFDNVKVATMPNKLNLHLPRLAQIDYAFELFKQSGTYSKDDIFKTLLGKTNYNSMDYLIFLMSKHNLDKMEFLNKNDEAVNTFFYKATLFYKKFTSESKMKNQLDSNKTMTSILGFFVKSDLLKMAELSTYNANLTLDEGEVQLVTQNYKGYLATDYEDFTYLSDSYANLCKECLLGSYEDNKANGDMMDYLNEGKLNVTDLCKDHSEDCSVLLDKYLDRCRNGDCYTFDNVCITKKIKLKVLLPSIPQVKLALRIFSNSKAHRGHHIVGLLKKILRMDTQKTLGHFIKMLAKHNMQMFFHNNEAEKVLNQFLYHSTLFFVRFLMVSRLIKFYSLGKFTLYLFSIGRYRYLKNMAETVTFGNKVALAGESLSNVMEEYREYLVSSNLEKHREITKYFSSMCKDVIIRYVSADKMSTEMFDAGSDVSAEDICGKNEKLDCPAFVQEFLDRCKKGDCYTLDTKVYFTSDRMYKLTLPILHQVDAAIYIFKNSKAYGNYAERLIKSLGPKKKVDSYVQFYRNLVSHNNKFLNFNSFDNEVINKYLYNSAVYFKFVNDNKILDNVDVSYLQEYKNTEHKIESFLKRMLKSIVGGERVRFKDMNTRNVFEVYTRYFNTTQVVKDDSGIRVFLGSCEKIFKMFKEMQNNDEMFLKYLKNLEED